jgi:uncharacterized protein (DUF433 family)
VEPGAIRIQIPDPLLIGRLPVGERAAARELADRRNVAFSSLRRDFQIRPEGRPGKSSVVTSGTEVRGRHLAVEHVLGMLAAGDTPEAILEGYPWLERADIDACLLYAQRLVGHERVEPVLVASGA